MTVRELIDDLVAKAHYGVPDEPHVARARAALEAAVVSRDDVAERVDAVVAVLRSLLSTETERRVAALAEDQVADLGRDAERVRQLEAVATAARAVRAVATDTVSYDERAYDEQAAVVADLWRALDEIDKPLAEPALG